jgi:glycosyltransferase involved in cell wall biosynthesis
MGWVSMNRYWHELTKAQKRQPNVSCYCPLKLTSLEQTAATKWKRFLARSIIYPLRVRLLRSDIVHLLDHSFADLLPHVHSGSKIVANVYDLIPLLDSTGLTSKQLTRYRRRVAYLKRAHKIIACSEFTKECILQFLPEISSEKITVIPLGVQLPNRRANTSYDKVHSILSVGSTLKRKNLAIIPAVLQHLKARGIHPKLIRIGGRLPTSLSQQITEIIGAEQLHELGFVSDSLLQDSYATSTLTFFPSTLEGFGLPVLEAMANSCPVVCSDSSSIPEVAGNAACLFSSNDARAAADHMACIMQNADYRQQLIKAGLERASTLTWDAHWSLIQAEYHKLYASPS